MSRAERDPLRVLLVEDNPGYVHLVHSMLQDARGASCVIETVDRVSAAVERLACAAVDVVLLDLGLPDARGVEAAARLCSEVPQVPVVVLTVLSEEDGGIEAVQRGAQEYLVKGQISGSSLWRALRYSVERKQAEESLRKAQKMESLGILAGGVAHDFNNMLGAILGHATLALKKLAPESPALPHVEKVMRATERAADLTRQMLAYSGRGQFQVRAANLNTLVRENLHLLEAAIPKGVWLRSELTEDLPSIDADIGQIQQVLMNLVINGAEAIGEGAGTVTVATSVTDLDDGEVQEARRSGEPLAPGRYVALHVHDDGPGMDAKTLARIFDPFFTTKFSGRGLGLAAVLGIVRGHGGTVRVRSTVGRGTAFEILLPAGKREPLPAAPLSRQPQPGAGGLILVIDDEEALREAVRDMLSSQGFRVIEAPDGRTGLGLYAERRQEIRLVLLDLSMPGMSGLDTLRHLKDVNPLVRVILCSGYNAVEACKDLPRENLAGFLQKPYTFDTLAREVERCLGGTEGTA